MTMNSPSSKDHAWFLFTLPTFLHLPCLDLFTTLSILLALLATSLLTWLLSPAGTAWKNARTRLGPVPIPGPRGLPVLGSLLVLTGSSPHRKLASAARSLAATHLMAFSIGNTPAVVSSDPSTAREILSHPSFADRPLKRSARDLMFGRAMGFAPNGPYWRLLRRIASSHLFAPHRIASHEPSRQCVTDSMIGAVADEQSARGFVDLRRHLRHAALNNIMSSVFGRTYDGGDDNVEVEELRFLVREGFELLGAFNWSDHLPWLSLFYDHCNVGRRCAALVRRVREFVKRIVDERRLLAGACDTAAAFVDVLLSLEGEEKLEEDDMIAVLWEMIFRGTDTTALLTEWLMAELILHPTIQRKLRAELDEHTANRNVTDADVARLPYLQAVIKETLRAHPPGPLLSWARLSTSDVHLSNGMVVPAHTTAMVNMWSITHDPTIWPEPDEFKPERFLEADVDVRGGDLRLAPFGAGRRVCPGKNAGMVAVGLWVARLVREFEWVEVAGRPVELDEVLKLSCEMRSPLVAVAVPRGGLWGV